MAGAFLRGCNHVDLCAGLFVAIGHPMPYRVIRGEVLMQVFLLTGHYGQAIFDSVETATRFIAQCDAEAEVRPYGNGWNVYWPGRFSAVAKIEAYKVLGGHDVG